MRGAGEEDLFGVRGDDAVEGELTGVFAAEFEEEAGTVAGLGVDYVDEVHAGGAIEMGGVGDALDGGLEVAERVGLGDDGDVAQGGAGASGVGGVDVCRVAAVAEGVGPEVFIEQRSLRGWGGLCGAMGRGGCGRWLLRGGCRSCCGGGLVVGGELGSGEILHLVEDGLVLGFVFPFEGEGMGVAIDGVGDGNHLVKIGGKSGELGEIGLVHGAGGFAVVKIGAAGIVVEGGARASGIDG